MKILYHHRIASKDGQYVHVEEMTEALRKQGHEIVFVGPPGVEREKFGSEGGLVATMKRHIPGFLYELLELGYSLHAYFRLKKAIVRHKPDVIYERYNLYMPSGIWAKRKYNLPFLLEVNAPLFDERSRYSGIAIPSLARWTERYTWRGADRVLPVTQVLANRVMEEGVSKSDITVIPNGINTDTFSAALSVGEAKARLNISEKLVLGFTGFMREWHGLDRVVEMIANKGYEHCHLLLVGDGPARQGILQKAGQLGISDRVTITGVVERADIPAYVAAFDIALQPDVVDYASPLKMFEYMYLGKAIVAPDKDNIREILTSGVDALLFDPYDDASFVGVVVKLIEDDGLRVRIGAEARNTIHNKRLTWSNNAVIVEQLVSEIKHKCSPGNQQ